MALILDQPLLLLVKHDYQDVLVAELGELDSLLDEPLLPLGEGGLHGLGVVDQLHISFALLRASFCRC